MHIHTETEIKNQERQRERKKSRERFQSSLLNASWTKSIKGRRAQESERN